MNSRISALKNPVVCEKCLALHPLKDYLKERSLPEPFLDAVEGILLCPSCGDVRHSYYMTEAVRNEQKKIQYAIRKLGENQTPENLAKIKVLRSQQKNFFDDCQQYYQLVLEKVAAQDGGRN